MSQHETAKFFKQCTNKLYTVRKSTGSKDAVKTDPIAHTKLLSYTMTLAAQLIH